MFFIEHLVWQSQHKLFIILVFFLISTSAKEVDNLYFIDEKTEIQRDELTHFRSHRLQMKKTGFDPSLVWLQNPKPGFERACGWQDKATFHTV